VAVVAAVMLGAVSGGNKQEGGAMKRGTGNVPSWTGIKQEQPPMTREQLVNELQEALHAAITIGGFCRITKGVAEDLIAALSEEPLDEAGAEIYDIRAGTARAEAHFNFPAEGFSEGQILHACVFLPDERPRTTARDAT
jgi:hypothetical protein